MKKIITLSGWGQKHDSLAAIAPDAQHIDYSKYGHIEELFDDIKGSKCDVLIGWSLGGQIAIRAIEAGVIEAEHLILIATPFQFISDKTIKCGMEQDSFYDFETDFVLDPKRTLKKFSLLVAKNDKKAKEISRWLTPDNDNNLERWDYWLDELGQFSCAGINFSNFPKTTIIHGTGDSVVDHTQSAFFDVLIKNCETKVLNDCGHAPHLHNIDEIKSLLS